MRTPTVVTSPAELAGWEVLYVERWKRGVVRIHARRDIGGGKVFDLLYAKDEVLNSYQLPEDK